MIPIRRPLSDIISWVLSIVKLVSGELWRSQLGLGGGTGVLYCICAVAATATTTSVVDLDILF